MLRAIIKISLFALLTCLGSLTCVIICTLLYPWHRPIGIKILQIYSKLIMIIFQVKIELKVEDERFLKEHQGVVLLANHTTSLDIPLLSAVFGSTFVSKDDLKYWPFIGWAALFMGVIFLKRSSMAKRLGVMTAIAEQLGPNRIVTIFPQGTTSNLTKKRPFQRGIFKIVEMHNHLSLLPVTVHYEKDEYVSWGEENVFENLYKLTSLKEINVTLTTYPLLTIEEFNRKDAKTITLETQKKVLLES